ncbi:MAG: hypothetical protein DRP78_02755 [Candidatus Omnitrophota bacterium]|nr:MAG: hypothetical protein DRP78_02755 [Candidatus Omnitrophota bacterium]
MKRPLVPMCVFFICGIIYANFLHIPFLFSFIFLILSFISAKIFLRRNFLFVILLMIVSFLLGACAFANHKTLPINHIANFAGVKGKFVQIQGVIENCPVRKKNKYSFILQTEQLSRGNSAHKVCGKVLVWCYKQASFKYGQEVILEGKLYQPYPFLIGKHLNYRTYLKNSGIYAMLSVSKANNVYFKQDNRGNFLQKISFSLREKIKQIIEKNLSVYTAGVTNAMLLGARSDVPQFMQNNLKNTGTVHILAVSGLHVGIIAFIIILFLKILRIPYKMRYVLTILFLVFYCFLTGARISVVRAVIMAVVLLSGALIERDYDPKSALSFAALIILFVNPAQIFSMGFQLSFVSVSFIFLFTDKIIALFSQKLVTNKLFKPFIISFSVSLCAWMGTAGIIAYYFNIFTPVSIIANIVIVPFLFLIVVNGIIFVLLSLIAPQAAQVLAINCEFFINLLYHLNNFFASIPGAYRQIKNVSWQCVVFYYLAVLLVLNMDCWRKYNRTL